jgi:hypothetical protein
MRAGLGRGVGSVTMNGVEVAVELGGGANWVVDGSVNGSGVEVRTGVSVTAV